MANCLISIGTNLGDRSLAIDRAVSALQVNDAITVSKVSNRHITQPVGGPAGQGAFLNAVALLETALAPSVLLSELQAIEVAAGRTREVRWGARSLDLDLLLYGEIVSNDGHLVLPHPRMAFRRFVLEPACEVAPSMMHPILGRSMRELLQHLDLAPDYVAITGVANAGKSALANAVAARTAARFAVEKTCSFSGDNVSPTLSAPAEIELLSCRSQLLQSTLCAAGNEFVISDFWLGQSLAFAKHLQPEAYPTIEQAYLTSACSAIAPKLIVVVELDFAHANANQQTEASIAIQRSLIELLRQPGFPPALRLNATNASWNEEEIVAAIQAM